MQLIICNSKSAAHKTAEANIRMSVNTFFYHVVLLVWNWKSHKVMNKFQLIIRKRERQNRLCREKLWCIHQHHKRNTNAGIHRNDESRKKRNRNRFFSV